MLIVNATMIRRCTMKYAQAKPALDAWAEQITTADIPHPQALVAAFGNKVDPVRPSRAVFNIKGNDFRLVVEMGYQNQTVTLLWFGPHKDYNRIDVATVPITKP